MLKDRQFPKQSKILGTRIKGAYMGIVPFEGELLRDDAEAPGIRIVRLDNGKLLLGTADNGETFQ